MDQGKFYTIIKQVTKTLTPESLKILDLDEDTLTIRVVSDAFSAVPMVKRFKLLADLFEKEAPGMAASHTLVFEAWTADEAKGLDANEKPTTSSQAGLRHPRAAKDADL